MGDMGMWGLALCSPCPAPIPITSKELPLTEGGFDPRRDLPTSPCPPL